MASQLRVDKIVPVDGAPSGGGGGIIQVQSATITNTFENDSETFADVTGVTVTITPKFNTSKILVSFNCHYDLNIANQRAYITNYRSIGGGTPADIAPGRGLVEIWNPDSRTQASCMAQYLDSPSTTSAVTYTIQHTSHGASSMYLNRSSDTDNQDAREDGISWIVLKEVGA